MADNIVLSDCFVPYGWKKEQEYAQGFVRYCEKCGKVLPKEQRKYCHECKKQAYLDTGAECRRRRKEGAL